jgi:hypothetical protein
MLNGFDSRKQTPVSDPSAPTGFESLEILDLFRISSFLALLQFHPVAWFWLRQVRISSFGFPARPACVLYG